LIVRTLEVGIQLRYLKREWYCHYLQLRIAILYDVVLFCDSVKPPAASLKDYLLLFSDFLECGCFLIFFKQKMMQAMKEDNAEF
jgi:hypothetical protein